MNGTVFVDTNVLVYAQDLSEKAKQPVARHWKQYLWENHIGQTSIQVLEEYYQTVTRKLKPGLSVREAQAEIRELLAWQPLPMSIQVLEAAWSLEKHLRLSFWDSLIMAAAQILGCRFLLTEDLQEGLVVGKLVTINPFHISLESLFEK